MPNSKKENSPLKLSACSIERIGSKIRAITWQNPYVESGDPCGSSSGSAIAVAANLVPVSLGTETDSSIICPADHNSFVGFKPNVGLISRAGVVPISARRDSMGKRKFLALVTLVGMLSVC